MKCFGISSQSSLSVLKYSEVFFLISFCGIEVFSQGANSNNFEVISRVYFGSTPFDANDIMNPPVGTTTLPCTGYSDFSLGNTNNGDAQACQWFFDSLKTCQENVKYGSQSQ